VRKHYRHYIKKLIPFFDIALALVYSVALLIQHTKPYKKIRPDTLKYTNKIVIRLNNFFDPTAYYSFYERLFYEKHLQSFQQNTRPEPKRTINSIEEQISPGVESVSNLLKSPSIGQQLEPSAHALVHSFVPHPPTKLFLYNTPKHLKEIVRSLLETQCRTQSTDIIDLNLFTESGFPKSTNQFNQPLVEIENDVVSQFDSDSFFLFGIDDAVPPLNHIKDIFTRIMPRVPHGMRIGVYGVSRTNQEDEWMKWNITFWSAQTLLEVLIANSENIEVECDSRFSDFSHRVSMSAMEGSLMGEDLIIFKKYRK